MPMLGVSPGYQTCWLAGWLAKRAFFQARSGITPRFWPSMPISNSWPRPNARATWAILSGPQDSAVW